MQIRDELERQRTATREMLAPADWRVINDTIEELRMRQLAEHSLAVGDTLPDFALPDATGALVRSTALLDHGPLALSFFRGGWCPYCKVMLNGLERARPAIEALGASLVAVSPLRSDELGHLAAKRRLRFVLLSDVGGRFAQLCGVQYELPEALVGLTKRFGNDLARLHAGAGWRLPLPAAYVVGADAVVRYAFADPDWVRRAEPEELVAAVRALAQPAPAAVPG